MDIRTKINGDFFSRIVWNNTLLSPLWLLIRVYVGWLWLEAGWEKLQSPAWLGGQAGTALHGFVQGALQKTVGAHPQVQSWYADFLRGFVDNHAVLFSHLVAYGEVLVGLGLILGLFTGLAAFFGSFMNLNYLLAGTVSINPILLILELPLMLAWRTSGWLGLDRYVLPKFLGKKQVYETMD